MTPIAEQTLVQAIGILQNFQEEINNEETNGRFNNALMATAGGSHGSNGNNRGFRGQGQGQGRGRGCNSYGGQKGQNTFQSSDELLVCWYCTEEGHMRKDCPIKQKADEHRNKRLRSSNYDVSQTNFAQAMTTEMVGESNSLPRLVTPF